MLLEKKDSSKIKEIKYLLLRRLKERILNLLITWPILRDWPELHLFMDYSSSYIMIYLYIKEESARILQNRPEFNSLISKIRTFSRLSGKYAW